MAKLIKLRGPIREFTVAVGAYSRGGALLTICSSSVGAYSRGSFFEGGGGSIRGFTALANLFMNQTCLGVVHFCLTHIT